jgi:hypothetical protein
MTITIAMCRRSASQLALTNEDVAQIVAAVVAKMAGP